VVGLVLGFPNGERKLNLRNGFVSIVLASAFGSAFGDTYDFASWTSSTSSSAVGTVDGVGVTVSGPLLFVDGDSGTNYIDGYPGTYESSLVSNMPTVADLIGMTGGPNTGTYTVTFSEAVYDPIFDWVSLGSGGNQVSINYGQTISLLSEGPGWWGGATGDTYQSGNSIYGTEGDGTVVVPGWVTSVTFTAPQYEDWYGFEIGSNTAVSSVPGPLAVAPFAVGLLGLLRLRKKA
jgi:hypothetical protein